MQVIPVNWTYMTQEELFRLFNKYQCGEATPQEAKSFLEALDTEQGEVLLQAYIKAYQTIDPTAGNTSHGGPIADNLRMELVYQQILKRVRSKSSKNPPESSASRRLASINRRMTLLSGSGKLRRIAALFFVLLISTALVIFFLALPSRQPESSASAIETTPFQEVPNQHFKKLVQTGKYTENLELPDHSNIVMRAGSRLGITTDFNATKRSVYLDGEAYFDVAHNTGKPFFIHTGPLTIQVLGTAFNVKSFSGQDSASIYVSRGKVLIWDKTHKLERVLTAHQSVVYQKAKQVYQINTQNLNEQQTLSWVSSDMIFDKVTMKQVLETLSRRYKVISESKDSLLLQTKVKISFKGTESLSNIMEALTVITGSDYLLQGDTLRIFKNEQEIENGISNK